MPNPRLELALSQIQPADWRAFEKFASEFLVVEYPNLRTMASPSGDRGRDGECFIQDGEPNMVFQYSVTAKWREKIIDTVQTLGVNFPNVTHITYVTNQSIGALADELKRTLRTTKSIILDIFDLSWFVERELTYPQRATASNELAIAFVDPLLSRRQIILGGSTLPSDEGRIAVLHLALENRDEISDRSLTKSCFNSLVLAVLHGTDTSNRMHTQTIRERVSELVPVGAPGQVDALVDSALIRLSERRGPVKHYSSSDEYHMSFDETERLKRSVSSFLLDEKAVEDELASALRAFNNGELVQEEIVGGVVEDLRKAIESILFRRGEAFAAAVQTGASFELDAVSLMKEISTLGLHVPLTEEQITAAIVQVLDKPSAQIHAHLRRLADAYTLFAFLRQTADVQKVMLQVFSEGDVWLDTNVILPLIGEMLIDESEHRHFTLLIKAAAEAGLNLFITNGVLEEVERHLNRCMSYLNTADKGTWGARIPFVISAYLLAGWPSTDFASWVGNIRGTVRPLLDIQEFLQEEFSVKLKSLAAEADAAPIELRSAVQELWMEAHEKRRSLDMNSAFATDPATISRLVAHDVENTVGVIELRRTQPVTPMGYRTWWLTLDKTALRLPRYLRDRLGPNAPASPTLSPDFLIQLLRLRPLRTALRNEIRISLPLSLDLTRLETVPQELLDLTATVRAASANQDERVIRREVRDAVDRARAKHAPQAIVDMKHVMDKIEATISGQP